MFLNIQKRKLLKIVSSLNKPLIMCKSDVLLKQTLKIQWGTTDMQSCPLK